MEKERRIHNPTYKKQKIPKELGKLTRPDSYSMKVRFKSQPNR